MSKIGYFDADIVTPEEIIMAAGFTPVRLLGDPLIEYEKANEHIPPTHCVWARNVLEQALRGLGSEIKGVITSHGCDCTNREFDIWLESVDMDFLYFLNVPLKRDKIAKKFFIKDMKNLIAEMEEKFGVEITDEKIQDAIRLTNKLRMVLKELSEYRSTNVLKFSELHQLVKIAQTSDKEEAYKQAQAKLKEIKDKEPPNEKGIKRILLTGSVIDDTEFIKNLEEKGFQIVADDLCIGTRYFIDTIDEHQKPLQALAEYHLSKPVYSTKFPSYKRFEFLKSLITKYKVDGVVNVAMKFCEPLLYSHPYFNEQFKEMGIPYLFIEMEYTRESYKQLATRFDAFAEIV